MTQNDTTPNPADTDASPDEAQAATADASGETAAQDDTVAGADTGSGVTAGDVPAGTEAVRPPAFDDHKLRCIVEGALLAAGKPLPLDRIESLFLDSERPERSAIEAALEAIAEHCADRGFELKKVASGYRFQVRQELSEWVGRLWEEKPQRYSRALMETLSIIAYRQPITRGDIEKIRGVAVSTQIVQTLLEHEWVRVVGHRDVPGRPAMYATTRQFLDYFNLESLDQLPPLSEIRDLEEINRGLSLEEDKPAGRIIEFPDPEPNDENLEVDEEEAAAAAIGTRPISEILSAVDARLGRRLAGEEGDEPGLADTGHEDMPAAPDDGNAEVVEAMPPEGAGEDVAPDEPRESTSADANDVDEESGPQSRPPELP